MSKQYNKLIIFVILMIGLISNLDSEEGISQNKEKLNMFSMGLGSIYQFSINKLRGNNYYAIRHYGQFSIMYLMPGGGNVLPSNNETGVLIGKAISFNTKRKGFISLSTGLSLVTFVRKGDLIGDTELYHKDITYTIGVLFDLNFTNGFSKNVAWGFNFTINLNKKKPFGGVFFNLSFGDFNNPHYNPKIRKLMEKSIKSNIKKKNLISFDIAVLSTIRSSGGKTKAIKPTLIINNVYKQFGLVIPIFYMTSNKSQIMNSEKELIIADILLRKYFPDNFRNYYFDFGFQYVYAYSERRFKEKPHRNFGCISISFGKRFNITKSLFIASQINMSKPVVGDLETYKNTFQEDMFSTSDFIIYLDIIKFGIEF